MNCVQENIDRLAVIISNYVAVNDIGTKGLKALDGLFDRLGASEHLRNFWRDRFGQAESRSQEEQA